MHFAGIEIGGTKLQLVVGDDTAKIVSRRRLHVDRQAGAAGIRKHIEIALPELLGNHRVEGIGVGFGGPVDWRSGRICVSHHIEGWSDFDLAGWLRGLSGLPVTVDNDANVAALGEALRGAGAGSNPVFYFNMGSGVGGGLVADGRIYHGIAPGEVEFGHLRLDRAGATVESRCSGWAIDARIRQLKQVAPDSLLAQVIGVGTGGEAQNLGAALTKGDPAAKRILDELATDLAFALSHVVHLFHPQIIVMGGGLSQVGEPLRAAVESALPQVVMEAFRPGPKICLARLREDTVPTGALLLAAAARLRRQPPAGQA